MTTSTVPESYAEVYRDYYKLVKWHVAKAKISPENVEDFSMELMEKFIKNGVLEDYDPEKGASFRTFFSGFVTSYLYGFKTRDLRHAERTMLSTDYTVGEDNDTLILDLKGYSAPDHSDEAEMSYTVAQVRRKLPEKRRLFFELVMLQVEEQGAINVPELAELFGVSTSCIHNWKNDLKPVVMECLG